MSIVKLILSVKNRAIFFLILFISGCTKITNQDSLKLYNGLLYDPDSGKPYTGKVYSLYSNGTKMRDGYFELGALDGEFTFYNNIGEIITPLEENRLIYKNGKKYNPEQEQPFWGMAYGIYESGHKLYEVVYENGLIIGDYQYFNIDGRTKAPIFLSLLVRRGDIFYQQDSPEPYTGPVFDIWENGNKMLSGAFKNSVKDGRWVEWFENGQPQKEHNYRFGFRHGYWAEWFENGLLEIEGHFVDGKEYGTWNYWYNHGQKEKEMNYDNGWWNGKFNKWYKNGLKMEELTYKDQAPVGVWQYWYDNGQQKEEKSYESGERNGE